MIDAALNLAHQGFAVFPIAAGKKVPPLLNGWPDKATKDAEEVKLYWLPVPDANIGIHCAGLLVLDADAKKGGLDALDLLRLTEGLPDTYTVRTPGGGLHLYYRLPEGHAGVPNSVEHIGKGLDVRSNGGYVVAAGSVTEAGPYAVETDALVAAAPDWLVERAGAARVGLDRSAAVVEDAPPEVVEKAIDYLLTAAPAVEGQGGDARTYATVCALRDMGLSRTQALGALLEGWNDRCSPPWELDELGVKVRNAYNYGQNEAGGRAALPDDFPAAEAVQESAPSTERVQLQSLNNFASRKAQAADYVIKGLLYRKSHAVAFGPPGEGKTFVALDWGFHAAAGAVWHGRRVKGGPVLYLAFEGTGGLVRRAQALRHHYGDRDVPLFIQAAAMDLRSQPGRRELGALLAGLPATPSLIVVDTLARALMGGDENSSQDMGALNQAVGALIESTGACVLVVHHTGKDKSKGARGSSALQGAIDTEIRIDGGQILTTKQRDVDVAPPIGFRLQPVVLGVDEDGDEITSCVVQEAVIEESRLPRITGNAKRGFDVLCQIRPTNKPVTVGEWRDACAEFLGGKQIAQRFYDVKKQLLAKGYIDQDEEGLITRRCE